MPLILEWTSHWRRLLMFQLPGVRNYTEAIDEAAARKVRHDRIQVGDNDTASQAYDYIGRDFLSPNGSFCESWR
jgi:hypothetical protein